MPKETFKDTNDCLQSCEQTVDMFSTLFILFSSIRFVYICGWTEHKLIPHPPQDLHKRVICIVVKLEKKLSPISPYEVGGGGSW